MLLAPHCIANRCDLLFIISVDRRVINFDITRYERGQCRGHPGTIFSIIDYLKGMCGTPGRDHTAVTAILSPIGPVGCFREIGFVVGSRSHTCGVLKGR